MRQAGSSTSTAPYTAGIGACGGSGSAVVRLRASAELARAHVLDQPLTQWADGIGTNGKHLSEVDDTSIIRARCPIADALDQVATHANKGSLSGLSRSDFVRWHHTDVAQRRKK